MKTTGIIILMPVLFVLCCGQNGPTAGPPEVTSSKPAQPKNSKINIDTFWCTTIELFQPALKTMLDRKPLPLGCYDLMPLTRVQGPFELRTIKSDKSAFTYALIETPQTDRVWVYANHITVFPDSVKPSPRGQAMRVTAEEFVRGYNDAQYQDEQVIVTGIVESANDQVIEMRAANSTTLEFSSSGMAAGVADFPAVRRGQEVTIKGNCIGRGLKDKQRFFFDSCSIVPTANR